MNFKINESAQKLQGSYYTPKWIADFVAKWIISYSTRTVLEPSCGDGVFFQALSDINPSTKTSILGFDTDNSAIQVCKSRNFSDMINLDVRCEDFLTWAIKNYQSNSPQVFDAIVGNPPFIRYQYLDKEMQQSAQELFNLIGINFTKHANAWIPFLLASICFLNPGGHIGMIVPAEILHVLYAQGIREYLAENCARILLVDPEDLWFEDTLQGAMLLLAEKRNKDYGTSELSIVRTSGRSFAEGDPRTLFDKAEYCHILKQHNKWTFALLTKGEIEAFNRVSQSTSVFSFIDIADVDVGIVTGANKFFLVTDDIVSKYGLYDVAHPMFGRSEHCRGIIYDAIQHGLNASKGFPTNFLYFESEEAGIAHQNYLSLGVSQGIPSRYKCRIRKPWYKVPSVYSSKVNMLKRSNGMPRLILNEIGALTTDTAYRISPFEQINADTLVYCFINTFTALSAELEGRFYGGGVLELVPSEIEHLLVVYKENEWDIKQLNNDTLTMSKDDLLKQQDNILFSQISDISLKDIEVLHEALLRLQARRQRIKNYSSMLEE